MSIARGASFDCELETKIGNAIGIEGRILGANLFAGVCINLLRHPAWGRAQETYGEDSFLLGEMGKALTIGVQRHLMACVKHFALNSMENSRFHVDVTVDDLDLREIYLPHFKKCIVEARAASVMSAYNSVNGKWCGGNDYLLNQILKKEWNFTGFVMSDFLLGTRYDGDQCLRAGLDLEMPFEYKFKKLKQLSNLDMNRVDDAVGRLLLAQVRFKHDSASNSKKLYENKHIVGCESHLNLAKEAAIGGMVLLRNSGRVLPLTNVKSIAVLGSLATHNELTGDMGSSRVRALNVINPLNGITQIANRHGVQVKTPYWNSSSSAAALAKAVDVAIVCVGNTHVDEGEYIFLSGGDRASLKLKPTDVEMICAVSNANPKTVVIMFGGSAFVTSEWSAQVGAIVMAWYPGMLGGVAIGEILFGEQIPGGRLPVSFAERESDYPEFHRFTRSITYGPLHGYRMLEANDKEASFAFGFGLGYTEMRVFNEKVTRHGFTINVEVDVENVGSEFDGVEVIQVYVSETVGSYQKPLRTLKAFQKVRVKPKRTRKVLIENVQLGRNATRVWIGKSSRTVDLVCIKLE